MALVCNRCGYKQYDEETIREYNKKFPSEEEHDIPYVCGACQNEEDKEMNYQEQIKKAVQEFYDVTKAFASSRHYTLSYWWVESNFGLDLTNKQVRDDVHEMSYSDEFCDLIQTVDFDDDKKEVTIMIWASNNKKKYTLKEWEAFCKDALIMPPFEDDEQVEEWFKTHKIHITSNNCVMELEYDADAVNEIEFSLREIYEAIHGSGKATMGNTVGSEHRPAELKDVVRYFIMYRYENYGGLNWFDYAQQAVVEMSDIQSVVGVYEEACKHEKEIDFKCNWHNFKIESLKDVTEDGIKKIILDLAGSNLEISYDSSTDKSFIIDYTFKESGDFIDWSWGKISEDEKDVILASYKETIFE